MVDEQANLARRITDALASLRCARAVVEHSANSMTRRQEDMAERALNSLLDQLPRAEPNRRAMVMAGTVPGPRTRA
jgi:hypothetical protein